MFSIATFLGLLAFAMFAVAAGTWFRLANQVAIPNNRLPFLGLWVAATALGIASFFSEGSGWPSGILGALAMAGSVALLGLYAMGTQGAGDPIAVGDHIPAFEAISDDGSNFASAELTGVPLLVKFFRGHW